MWGLPFQGIKIVHEQMIQEALEHRTFPRRAKHIHRSSLKDIFEAVQAHCTTTSACQPQAVLPCCNEKGSCSNS